MEKPEWTANALIGGHPALDFVNTVGGATKKRDIENLPHYDAVLHWCAAKDLLTFDEITALARLAATNTDGAQESLGRLQSFRESLHTCLIAQQAVQPWPDDDKGRVEAMIKSALSKAHLANQIDGGMLWDVERESTGLELPLMRLALTTEELLRSDELTRMRNCERCSWLFIDRGRGRPRRWCSMATCGSRAKSSRYYRRHKHCNDAADQ